MDFSYKIMFNSVTQKHGRALVAENRLDATLYGP